MSFDALKNLALILVIIFTRFCK